VRISASNADALIFCQASFRRACKPNTRALVNAIYDAVGMRLRQIPATPERVWHAIQKEGR
jgi:hypothetical protein